LHHYDKCLRVTLVTVYDTRYSDAAGRPEASGAGVEPTLFCADDGFVLRGTWFHPQGTPRGAVVIAPAMATPAAYYAPFATWLAESGFLALTYDYRGMGSVDDLRAARDTSLLQWAGDAARALETLLDRAAGLPVTYLGHSMGAQVLPFVRHDLVSRIVMVSTGVGSWRFNRPRIKVPAWLMFRLVSPVVTRLAGYYPGRALRMTGDLPTGAMRQWARWCMSPDYFEVDVPDIRNRFAEITVPVTSLHFADDELLSEAAMTAMEALFTGTDVDVRRVTPAALGADSVGHHGLFRARLRPAWDDLVGPLLAT
jgi:predicted alpha/beta hydrolase